MTDEELGRRWCEANRKRPYRDDDGFFMWFPPRKGICAEGPSNLPVELTSALWSHKTKEHAYAAVGAAIRGVWAFADMSRGEVQT